MHLGRWKGAARPGLSRTKTKRPLDWMIRCAWVLACILGSTVAAQQGQEAPEADFNFTPRTLEDGSETFDAMIRSRDGLFIFGSIRKPPGEGPFPGIILVHGGLGGKPDATRNLVLKSTPARRLVANGYAVLSTDFRAGEWITEYQDIVSAYEYFRQLSYVRGDAIAMMGGSRGARLVLNVVSRVRLQAVVTCAGPYDQGKFWEYCRTSEYHQKLMQLPLGSEIAVSRKEVVEAYGGTPAEVPGRYQQHNAMSRVGDVQTPFLVVHGEQDPVVPALFGRELVAALREQGKVVDEHFAPQGFHSFYWGYRIERGNAAEDVIEENELLLEHLISFLAKHLGLNQKQKG